jgi:hypothetical protein
MMVDRALGNRRPGRDGIDRRRIKPALTKKPLRRVKNCRAGARPTFFLLCQLLLLIDKPTVGQ